MRVLTTTLFILIAGVLSVGLFWLKVQVQDLEAELVLTERTVVAERQAIRVLNAEWSLLNDPVRLRGLVEQHLDLAPTDARQITRIADVDAMPMATPAAVRGARHDN